MQYQKFLLPVWTILWGQICFVFSPETTDRADGAFLHMATTVMPAKCQPLPRISSDRMTSLTSSSTVADHLILPPTDKYVDGWYHSTTIYRSLPMLNRGKCHTTTSQRTAHTFSTNTEECQLSCITAYNWTPINAIFFICTMCTVYIPTDFCKVKIKVALHVDYIRRTYPLGT